MNLTATRTSIGNPFQSLKKTQISSAGVYSAIIVFALIAFEAVNYSTTAFALKDLLGNLKFLGIRWSTLLALAFCSLRFCRHRPPDHAEGTSAVRTGIPGSSSVRG